MRFGRFSVPWPVAKTGVFEIWYNIKQTLSMIHFLGKSTLLTIPFVTILGIFLPLGPDFEQYHLSHEFYSRHKQCISYSKDLVGDQNKENAQLVIGDARDCKWSAFS